MVFSIVLFHLNQCLTVDGIFTGQKTETETVNTALLTTITAHPKNK
jgi:uncharacterized HAD superfamily protein